jgi:hypothetical protein
LDGVRKVPVFTLFFLAGIAACPAALEWKTTDLQLAAQPGQQAMSLTFPFRNAGDRPVRILSLDPSCSCMSATPDKAVCAPGESGEIRVELALTGYAGRVRRSVAVATDAADGKFAELTLTVEIPELIVITPRFLFWRVGAESDEKVAEVVVTDPKTTSLDRVECANPRFHAQLSPGLSGVFRLTVKPTDTRQPEEAMIHLNVIVGGRPQEFVIYAAVK